MTPRTSKKSSQAAAKSTAAQTEIIGYFNDYAWEDPKLNFESVTRNLRAWHDRRSPGVWESNPSL
jgi:hypothetical protein